MLTWQSIAITAVFLSSIISAQAAPKKLIRKAAPEITHVYAQARAQQVSDVKYLLNFNLDEKSKDFAGQVQVKFKYKANPALDKLTIDFAEGKVTGMKVNDKVYTAAQAKAIYNASFISIPVRELAADNVVVIDFTHPFSTTGSGFYRYEDPVDKRVYTYTDFEPYDANRLFPCFDQPDLKGTYTVQVSAPKEWKVISTIAADKVSDTADGKKSWSFPETKPFSTYIFSLIAGPYHEWKDKAGNIPLGLYARQSMAKWVPVDHWFKITKQGLKFFNNYFNYAYPFGKYDQIVVPDFNAGAMENVGSVTFNERYAPMRPTTVDERERHANVILHEMAHMWFGDLVTMKWWDDLWLNESFATFMAYYALTEVTEYKNGWETFYSANKQWAYWEDQLITTHPIYTGIANTSDAFGHFDGITYGKGASVLKQTMYFLGADNFREGMRKYFKKHEYQNTTLSDFIGALAEASGKDLGEWTNLWLKSAGLNQIRADYQCEGEKIKSFALEQTFASGEKKVRPHRTVVGFYQKNAQGGLTTLKEIPLEYSGARTEVKEAIGLNCPDVVYPNASDYDYAKVKLDKRSLDNLASVIQDVDNTLLRTMFWQSLWDMVRDSEYSLSTFTELAIPALETEKDFNLAKNLTGYLYGRSMNGYSVLNYLKYLPKGEIAAQALESRLEGVFWEQLQSSLGGSEFQKLWFNAFTSVARTDEGIARIRKLLTGELEIKGLPMNQEYRWSLIFRLNRLGAPDGEQLIAKELSVDTTEVGQKSALSSRAVRPTMGVKKNQFKTILASDMSLARKRSIMWSMFPVEQTGLRKQFASEYFGTLPKLVKNEKQEFVSAFTESLVPFGCDAGTSAALGQYIKSHQGLPHYVQKKLKVALDENQRCERIIGFAKKSAPGGLL